MNAESLVQLSKQPNEFLKKIKENINLKNDKDDLFDKIVQANNSGEIKLVEILTHEDNTSDFKNLDRSNLIEKLLPKIKLNITDANKIADFCIEKSLYIKSASYNNFFANIVTNCSEKDKNEILIKWITEKPNERKNIIIPLLLSKKEMSEVEALQLLMPLIRSGEETIIGKCLLFLDRNFINNPELLHELNIITEGKNSEEIKEAAIFCLINFSKKGEISPEEIIKKTTNNIKNYDFHINTLFHKRDSISEEIKLFLYKEIKEHAFISDNNSTLINFIISDLIIHEDKSIVVDFLERMAEKEDNINKMCNLSSINHELVKNEDLFKEIVTKWFSGNRDHLLPIIDSIQNKIAEFKNFDFENPDISTDYLDENHLVKIIIRCSGWFFFRPRLAFNFIFPIYEKLNEIAKNKVQPLIESTFLFNYPLNLEEYIKEKPYYDLSKKIALTVNERKNNIEKSWGVKELKSSSSLIVEFERNRQKEMEAIHKEADKKSIFSQLFAKLPILYGNGNIYYVEGINTPPSRQESMMGTIEHSFENPAMMVTDPIGLEMIIIGNKFGELK